MPYTPNISRPWAWYCRQKIFLTALVVVCSILQGAFANPKVFILTGEASGDFLGAWYARKLKLQTPEAHIEAIGGDALRKEGASLYDSYDRLTLGFVGLGTFLYHLPERYRQHKRIAQYIMKHNFSHVVLVDCPLTNFALARSLKKQKPAMHITYVAPPEMWIWGKWGMPWWLRSYCNKVVVIYPFEVSWYKKQGLTVIWEGYPYLEAMRKGVKNASEKENTIALLPGSRRSEFNAMLPLFADVIKTLSQDYKDLRFMIPLAQSFRIDEVAAQLRGYGVYNKVELLADKDPLKYERLASCCMAITKPGTVTLLLALLGVPSIITYRIPWFTYLLARALIQVPYVGLPNLMLNREVFPELLQSHCTSENIIKEVKKLYTSYLLRDGRYQHSSEQLQSIQAMLQDPVC